MTRSNLQRFFSLAFVGMLIGLLSAKVSAFDRLNDTFSWPGFLSGLAMTVAAFVLSRPLACAVNRSPPGTPRQRSCMSISLALFLLALVSMNLLLYTNWSWPRIVLIGSVLGGVICVAAGFVLLIVDRPGSRQ